MAKTKVGELAATLKMDGAQLVEQINKFDLGFTVKTPTSQLTEDQVKEIQQALTRQQRQANSGPAVRVRRRKADEVQASKSDEGAVSVKTRKADHSANASKSADAKKVDSAAAASKAADVSAKAAEAAQIQVEYIAKATANAAATKTTQTKKSK